LQIVLSLLLGPLHGPARAGSAACSAAGHAVGCASGSAAGSAACSSAGSSASLLGPRLPLHNYLDLSIEVRTGIEACRRGGIQKEQGRRPDALQAAPIIKAMAKWRIDQWLKQRNSGEPSDCPCLLALL